MKFTHSHLVVVVGAFSNGEVVMLSDWKFVVEVVGKYIDKCYHQLLKLSHIKFLIQKSKQQLCF